MRSPRSRRREQGIDAVFDNFRIVLGPKGTRREQFVYWEAMFARLTESDEWKNSLETNGWIPAYLNGSDTRKSLRLQYEEIKTLLNDLGLAKN